MHENVYIAEKVAFVSHLQGTSQFHINVTCCVALTSYALWLTLRKQLALSNDGLQAFLLDFLVLACPLLLALTVLSNHNLLFNIGLGAIALLVSLSKRRSSSEPVSHVQAKENSVVTVHRAHMMLMTVISILAVDFHVFPRAFAKCERYGTSIMDLGVGSFVFSNGMMQALAFIKSDKLSFQRYLLRTCKRILVPVVLGLARIIAVKGTKYPEHVTEYGVHWNFFLTLALLPLLCTPLKNLYNKYIVLVISVLSTLLHQLALDKGLASWTFDAPRTSLVSANKEGLASLPGYFAIYLTGLSIGFDLFNGPQWNAIFPVLISIVSCISYIHLNFIEVSRQLANLRYVVWMGAFNSTFLVFYQLLERLLGQSDIRKAPQLFSALNKNGMVIFLIANLLTGLFNLNIQTLLISDMKALLLLLLYLTAVCLVAWTCRNRRLLNL